MPKMPDRSECLRLVRLKYSIDARVNVIQAECSHLEAKLDKINMRLENIKYSESVPEFGQRWTLSGLELGARNLIVGKNASGKSRTVNVMVNAVKRIRSPYSCESSEQLTGTSARKL